MLESTNEEFQEVASTIIDTINVDEREDEAEVITGPTYMLEPLFLETFSKLILNYCTIEDRVLFIPSNLTIATDATSFLFWFLMQDDIDWIAYIAGQLSRYLIYCDRSIVGQVSILTIDGQAFQLSGRVRRHQLGYDLQHYDGGLRSRLLVHKYLLPRQLNIPFCLTHWTEIDDEVLQDHYREDRPVDSTTIRVIPNAWTASYCSVTFSLSGYNLTTALLKGLQKKDSDKSPDITPPLLIIDEEDITYITTNHSLLSVTTLVDPTTLSVLISSDVPLRIFTREVWNELSGILTVIDSIQSGLWSDAGNLVDFIWPSKNIQELRQAVLLSLLELDRKIVAYFDPISVYKIHKLKSRRGNVYVEVVDNSSVMKMIRSRTDYKRYFSEIRDGDGTNRLYFEVDSDLQPHSVSELDMNTILEDYLLPPFTSTEQSLILSQYQHQ